MEILIFLSWFGLLSAGLITLVEQDDPLTKTLIVTGTIFLFSTVGWGLFTDRSKEEVKIHTTTTEQGVEWKYYVEHDGDIIPVSNNVTKVIQYNRRKGSIEEPQYIVKYD